MKNLTFIALIILSMTIGCGKDDPNNYGQITGPDMSLCPCCGGWFIEIEDETYRFFNLPENSGINLTNESWPIYVELEWVKDGNGCMGDEIFINSIRKR